MVGKVAPGSDLDACLGSFDGNFLCLSSYYKCTPYVKKKEVTFDGVLCINFAGVNSWYQSRGLSELGIEK